MTGEVPDPVVDEDTKAGAPDTRPAIPDDVSDVDRAAIQARYDSPFYCPGCGRPYGFPAECTGTATAGHPPIQSVSTDELSGDPAKFTAAPSTEG